MVLPQALTRLMASSICSPWDLSAAQEAESVLSDRLTAVRKSDSQSTVIDSELIISCIKNRLSIENSSDAHELESYSEHFIFEAEILAKPLGQLFTNLFYSGHFPAVCSV